VKELSMLTYRRTICGLAVLALAASWACARGSDDLRNVKRGEPVPTLRLPTIDGTIVDSETMKGSVVVVLCLSAEQRRSELAAMDSFEVVSNLEAKDVRLVHVTADVIQKAYFERFRRERQITAPLALDADRSYYAKLGLIVYPTTIVIDRDGRLAHVISLHSADYKHTLGAYLSHTLGDITDEELEEELSRRSAATGTPKSMASAHRALARSLRERGQLESAREELQKAREQDPENREILLDIADLELLLGNLDEAESIVRIVLDSQPDHRRAKQVKGIILYRRGKLEEAKAVLEESLVLNPSPELAHYYLGLICEHDGETAAALAHYREALRRLLHEPTPGASGNDED
jgi:tetratricopeptide (TPR) repeat protein